MHKTHAEKRIHNITVVGMDGVGKTTLVNTLLNFKSKQDKIDIVTLPEEDSRGYTIYNKFYHLDIGDEAINIIDTPGNTNFLPAVKTALHASTGAIFTASPTTNSEGALRIWEAIIKFRIPRVIFVNMMEQPKESFDTVLESLEKNFSIKPTILFIPWYEGGNLSGVIDIINKKLYKGAEGKITIEDAPAEASDDIELYRGTTYERLAELDDELMEYYIEEKPAPDDLLIKVLSQGVRSFEITPVIAGGVEEHIGIENLLDFIKVNFPDHTQGPAWTGRVSRDEDAEQTERKPDKEGTFSGVVFKTTFDRYIGKLSFIRVISGTLKKGMKILDTSNLSKLTVGKISIISGDKIDEIEEGFPGDIVVLEKVDDLASNETICDISDPVFFEPVTFITPRCANKLELTNSSKDGRIMDALNKVIAADPSLKMRVDPETKEVLLSGMGIMHLEVTKEYLANVYEVEINLVPYQIAYRETIVGKSTVQGKYKKQSGGHGQYGDVHITIEPMARGTGFEFVDKIVGGAIPRTYIPSVEKGVKEALQTGTLAGYPVVDIRVTLFDGTFHAVDSSDFAFQRAGVMAINKAIPEARPVLLEPMMDLEIDVLESDVGKITKDLSGRRGKVSSYSYGELTTIVHAEAPLSELVDYAQALRGMTVGLGTFDMKLKSYEILASNLAEKVITARKQGEGEE